MTQFASPERDNFEIINKNYDSFYNNVVISKILSTVPNIFLVLNKHRQAIFCNQALIELLELENPKDIIGKRPGEIFNCIHANESEEGCGTTEFCRTCGAVKAILETQKTNRPSKYECRMFTKKEGALKALTLEVFTDILELENDVFTTFHITSIDEKKREEVLQDLLFNDILHTAEYMSEKLSSFSSNKMYEEEKEYLNTLQKSAQRLSEEIRYKQEIQLLENGSISIKKTELNSLVLLLDCIKKFYENRIYTGKKITVDVKTDSVIFISDPKLLEHAIQNLFANALEYSRNRNEIKTGCINEGARIKFWVWNEDYIPRDIQLQIFQKSFTTKNSGRGYGTYSSKLIIENFLGGYLSLSSDEKEGTTFIIDLPNRI